MFSLPFTAFLFLLIILQFNMPSVVLFFIAFLFYLLHPFIISVFRYLFSPFFTLLYSASSFFCLLALDNLFFFFISHYLSSPFLCLSFITIIIFASHFFLSLICHQHFCIDISSSSSSSCIFFSLFSNLSSLLLS